MQVEQLGAKEKCRGTTDNLLIDRMVCQDSQRGRKTSAWRGLMYERHMTQQITNGLRNVQSAPLFEMDWQCHSRTQCEMEYKDNSEDQAGDRNIRTY